MIKQDLIFLATLLLSGGGLLAGTGADVSSDSAGASLELQVESRRLQGPKLLGTTLRTLHLVADSGPARSSAGVMMPVQARFNGESTVIFKDVGTGLRCEAKDLGDGRFRLPCQLDETSPSSGENDWDGSLRPTDGTRWGSRAVMRLFHLSSTLLLRDGQSAGWFSGIDPATGETVDVTVRLKVPSPPRTSPAASGLSEARDRSLSLQVELRRQRDANKANTAAYRLRLVPGGEPAKLDTGIVAPLRVAGGQQTLFKNLGLLTSCAVNDGGDGRWRVECEIEQDAPYGGRDDWAAMGAAVESFTLVNTPVVRVFRASGAIDLAEGQPTRYALCTDPVTGETVTVTLTVKAEE